MSPLAQHEIETIVRMVVDRLRDGNVAGASQAGKGQAAGQSVGGNGTRSVPATLENIKATSLTPPGTLVLQSPLVTLEDIDGKLSGITTLHVAKRSLLTPAVRDELRRFNIKIVRGDAAAGSAVMSTSQAVSTVYHIVAATEKFNVIKSVVKQIAVNAWPASSTMTEIASQLSQLEAGHRALWCATRPYAAALACSQASSRSRVACLHQPTDLNQAVLEIQPNLLVIDDARWSGYQLGRLVQAWSRYGDNGGLT